MTPAIEFTSANIWDEWFPENVLADLLAGHDVFADTGQVKGAWKAALRKEIKAGRLVTWKGHWFPHPGSPFGMGPLKTCYGIPEIRDAYAQMRGSR